MIPSETAKPSAIVARSLYRKITWRIIPYLFLLYIVAYVDRVNVGFAAMDMKRQLGFSDTVYGTGAGIFFIGYALFDMPSNLMVQRVGTRVWIARIMITWGLIAGCMAFVHSAGSFYTMRFLSEWARPDLFRGCCFISPSGSLRTNVHALSPSS
jgi:ACS family tartrate transporter-like MFS transporter